jgi:hypothetical protein
MLTISGSAFSMAHSFTANQVFVGGNKCEVQAYYTSSNSLTCITPPGTGQALIRILVDNKLFSACMNSNGCQFSYSSAPVLSEIIPTAAPAGAPVQFYARTSQSNIKLYTDLLIGGNRCSTAKYLEDSSGLTESYYRNSAGWYKAPCDLPQLVGGYYNATLTLSSIGSAVYQPDRFLVDDRYNSYMFESVPQILNVSANSGSINGGTTLTITGTGFSSVKQENSVTIEGNECTILSSKFNEIICETGRAINRTQSTYYRGNRGLHYQKWNDIGQKLWNNNPKYPDHPDEEDLLLDLAESPCVNCDDDYGQRIYGLFTPRVTGNHTFYVSSDDQSQMFLSTDEDPSNKKQIAYINSWVARREYFTFAEQSSQPVFLEKGKSYYLEASQMESYGSDHFSIGVRYPSDRATVASIREIQSIQITTVVKREKQTIYLLNAVNGWFRIKSGDKTTNFITLPATVDSIYSAINAKLGIGSISVEKSSNKQNGTFFNVVFNEPAVNERLLLELDSSGLVGSSGGATEGVIIRTVDPSQPVSGTFDVTIYDVKLTIPFNMDAGQFKEKLQSSVPGIGKLDVTGANNYYDGYTWKFTFLDGQGDIPAFIVDGTKLSGTSVAVKSVEVVKGSFDVLLAPMPVQLISTVHSQSQVLLSVNSIAATCVGDCSFVYDEEATPIINDVDPDAGSQGSKITITGEKLESTIKVSIGGYDCHVEKVTPDQIKCTAADVPGGTASLVVFTSTGKSNSLEFNGLLSVTSITPNTGSYAGGTLITLGGYGFSEASTVSVDGLPCIIQSSNFTEIKCLTPSILDTLEEGLTGNGTETKKKHVVVASYDDDDFVEFIYSEELTPEVLQVTPTKISALEPVTQIVVGGYGFDSSVRVVIGDVECAVGYVSDERIECSLETDAVGELSVDVFVTGKGQAANDYTISRNYQIDSISPVIGSMIGGTPLRIKGKGLRVVDDLHIYVGATECILKAEESSNDELLCLTPAKEYEDKYEVAVVVAGRQAPCSSSCPMFEYSEAITPIITSFSPIAGIEGDVITIDGTGLGDSTAFFGDAECITLTATKTQVICSLGAATATDSAKLSLTVDNVGLAEFDEDSPQNFTYRIRIDSIEPNTGSKAGTRALITGVGFSSDNALNTVKFGDDECIIVSSSLREIECDIPPYSEQDNGLMVVVDNQFSGMCSNSTCEFTYSDELTPTINNYDPTTGQKDTVIVFTGTNIGKDVSVTIGDYNCPVTFANQNQVQCKVQDVIAGTHIVRVFVEGKGYPQLAQSLQYPLKFTSVLKIDDITGETTGSLAGGSELVISGQGFSSRESDVAETSIDVCGIPCDIVSSNYSEIVCTTRRLVTDYTASQYNWKREELLNGAIFGSGTPERDGIKYSNAFDGDESTYFATNSNSQSNCYIGFDIGSTVAAVPTSIQFLPRTDIAQGRTRMTGYFQGSNDKKTWTNIYQVKSADVNYNWNTVGLVNSTVAYRYFRYSGGGNSYCSVTDIKFFGYVLYNGPLTCNVGLHLPGGLNIGKNNSFVYSSSKTATISAISPTTGTAAGGTLVTITGTDFGTSSKTTVSLNGVSCAVKSVTNTQIKCETGARNGFAEISEIVVDVYGKGIAAQPDTVTFQYIDKWSAKTTWGNQDPPSIGQSPVIPPGQTILLDVSPPPLTLLIIEGTLIFDDTQDIHLEATYIFIKGGKLQIGTEDKPYQHQATITMHGKRLETPEIPIYGAKGMSLRGGLVDMHGIPRKSWTKLSKTVNAGDNILEFSQDVDWVVGDRLVVAPTDFDMFEAEEVTVIEKLDTNRVRVDPPLQYLHFADVQTFGKFEVDTRAEVGLLNRNIVFEGDEESVDEQFGAHFMIHSHGDDSSVARISNCEFRRVGQAFNLGRYPIHFHMIGKVTKSYAKNNAVHHTYNRAFAIHGVHYLRIHSNFAYHVMGHTYFIEDGIETNNELIGNLGILTLPSTSLLNTDTSPAVFWVTNPNNIWKNNAAAGSLNYGYWFDLVEHPTGASLGNDQICSNNVPLGTFFNNTAHTVGRYGLRIFESFHPRVTPCSASSDTVPAVFEDFTGWKCGRVGTIATLVGDIRFKNFKVLDNKRGGIEVSVIDAPYGGPRIQESAIIAYSKIPNRIQTLEAGGVVTPRSENFRVEDVQFYNFDSPQIPAIESCSKCNLSPTENQGGYTTNFAKLTFVNSPYRVRFQTPRKDIYFDEDNTLTGIKGGWAIPDSPHNRHPACTADKHFDGLVCTNNVQIRRVTVTNTQPTSTYDFKDLFVESEYGRSRIPFKIKNFRGWLFTAIMGQEVKVFGDTWVDWTQTSIGFYKFQQQSNDYFYLTLNHTDYRDHFEVTTSSSNQQINEVNSTTPLDPSMPFGSYSRNVETNQTVTLLAKGISNDPLSSTWIQIYGARCPREGCPVPPRPGYEKRVGVWSSAALWGDAGIPTADSEVIIYPGWEVTLDISPPKLKSLTIQGTLYFGDADLVLQAEYIFLQNGTLEAGTPEKPFTKKAQIILHGTRSTFPLLINNEIDLGAKVLANFGQLNLHGAPRDFYTTRIAQDVESGKNTIVVEGIVDWKEGDLIVIGTASSLLNETETATIAKVDHQSGNTKLTLEQALQFRHHGTKESIGTSSIDIRSVVSLLTRNIVITGSATTQQFGCHTYTGYYLEDGTYENKGKASIDSVQFINCGQVDSLRHQVTFENLDASDSVVSNCAFQDGFNTAVAAIEEANSLRVLNNVVYKTIQSSFVAAKGTTGNEFIGNVVYWTVGRVKTNEKQVDVLGSFETRGLSIVQDNIVVGCEDMGIIVEADDCHTPDSNLRVKNNQVFAAQIGFFFAPTEFSTCLRAADLLISKSRDYGIMSYIKASVAIRRVTLVDNRIGINLNSALNNPSSFFDVQESVFVGESNNYAVGRDCDSRSGILSFSYLTAPKDLPPAPTELPWHNVKSDPAIWGKNTFKDIVIAKFLTPNKRCGGIKDRILMTNPLSPDVTLPHIFSEVTYSSIDNNARIYLSDPDPGWRNDDDCGDMDCEGLKHSSVFDSDGTLTGYAGSSYISNNPTLADPARCTLINAYNAYFCKGISYQVLALESLDPDRLDRRVAPFAVTNMKTNLTTYMNNPMDHAWHLDYTSQKRLSSFWPLVEVNTNYKLQFTSTNPTLMRFYLLNAPSDQSVLVTIKYTNPNKLVVYSDDGKFVESSTSVIPELSARNGANLYEYKKRLLHFIVRGSRYVEINQIPVVQVQIRLDVALEDFFEDKFVSNIADSLNIDPKTIRVVDIRRGSTIVDFEIVQPIPLTNNASSDPISTTVQTIQELLVAKVTSGQLAQTLGYPILNFTAVVSDNANGNSTTNTTKLFNDPVEPNPVTTTGKGPVVRNTKVVTFVIIAIACFAGVVLATTIVIIVGMILYRKSRAGYKQTPSDNDVEMTDLGNIRHNNYVGPPKFRKNPVDSAADEDAVAQLSQKWVSPDQSRHKELW